MIDTMHTAIQGGLRFFPALGLSVFLHGTLLFVLYTSWPMPGGGGGGIRIDLVSLPGASGGQGAPPEEPAFSAPPEARGHAAASSRIAEAAPATNDSNEAPVPSQTQDAVRVLSKQASTSPVPSPATPKPRIGPARPKKNPTNTALRPETKKHAAAGQDEAAQGASGSGPDAVADGQTGGSAGLSSGSLPDADPGLGAQSLIPLTNPKPVYPEPARRRGQEGVVVLLAEVDAEGAAKSVSIRHSSGHNLLDEAAVSAVQQWRFRPARLAGAAVAGRVLVPVEFRLHP